MKVLFREGQPYMAGVATYPETYSSENPAWCWEEQPGLWVIRYAGERADTICEYGTEDDEAHARSVVDMLNGVTERGRSQLAGANHLATDLSKRWKKKLEATTQGVLL